MLHILLLILKIIGILLAVIVGVVLLAVLCVLFVPVRYRIKAEGRLGGEPPFLAEIKVTWLLHIVNMAFSYPKAAYLKVRIFCFTILDTSKERADNSRDDTDEIEYESLTENPHQVGEGEDDEKGEFDKEEAEALSKKLTEVFEEDEPDKEQDAEEIDAHKEGTVGRFFAAVKEFLKRLWLALKNIKYTIGRICDKIKKIINDIEYYTELLQSELFQKAFGVSKKQLMRVMRALCPGKCRINLNVGTGDPASTGQILAVYGMLYPFIGNNVFIQADFEEQKIEGDLYIKGSVTICRLLWAAFILYTDKNIRQLIKMLKREDA